MSNNILNGYQFFKTCFRVISIIFKRVLWLPQATKRKNDDFKKIPIFDLWGILFHRFDLVVKAES